MNKETRYLVIENEKIGQVHIQSLFVAYYPLISQDAVSLLMFLMCESKSKYAESVLRIRSILGIELLKIIPLLKELATYELIRYYQYQSDYTIEILLPLTISEFVVHPIYGAKLEAHLGPSQFEKTIAIYTPQKKVGAQFSDITETYDILVPNEASHTDLSQKDVAYDFLIQQFLSLTDYIVFPESLRTQPILDLIGQKGDFYGITPLEMKKIVGECTTISPASFDENKFNYLCSKVEGSAQANDPYQLSPIVFLKKLQHGHPVTAPDKKMLLYLVETLRMKKEVVNVLIEYILKKTNYRLDKNYVEKIAGTWLRNEIDSKEKALQFIQTESQQTQKSSYRKNNTAKPGSYQEDDDELLF